MKGALIRAVARDLRLAEWMPDRIQVVGHGEVDVRDVLHHIEDGCYDSDHPLLEEVRDLVDEAGTLSRAVRDLERKLERGRR